MAKYVVANYVDVEFGTAHSAGEKLHIARTILPKDTQGFHRVQYSVGTGKTANEALSALRDQYRTLTQGRELFEKLNLEKPQEQHKTGSEITIAIAPISKSQYRADCIDPRTNTVVYVHGRTESEAARLLITKLRRRHGENFMSTNDVPGASATNNDVLAAGCWAEHEDGSLLYVKGTENNRVVYELYDMQESPVVYYQDAMAEDDFKKAFSFPPVGTSDIKWTWHDKTPFPWDKVISEIKTPKPQMADSLDILSAAAKVAKSLRLRAQNVAAKDVEHMGDTEGAKAARSIGDRIQAALDAFVAEG